jgi:hypothetical protein
MRTIAVILSAVVILLANATRARAEVPDVQLQVLKYQNGKLEFRLGTNCGELYPRKKVKLFLAAKRVGSLIIGDGGESGMGLSPTKTLTVAATSVLQVETPVGTFSFKLDPTDLHKRAANYEWIDGELKN